VANGLALFEAQEDFIAELMRQIVEEAGAGEVSAGGMPETASIADAALAFAGGGNGARAVKAPHSPQEKD
jgi:hypothetical protein